MKVAIVLASLAALVIANPLPPSTACFVRRDDGLYERGTQCHYKRGDLDTDACLLKRDDGLYERGKGCGYYQ